MLIHRRNVRIVDIVSLFPISLPFNSLLTSLVTQLPHLGNRRPSADESVPTRMSCSAPEIHRFSCLLKLLHDRRNATRPNGILRSSNLNRSEGS